MPKKVLTRQQELIARGLFALAQSHYKKVRAAEAELSDFLGYEDIYAGHFSDEIYDDGGTFERAIKSSGMTVKGTR